MCGRGSPATATSTFEGNVLVRGTLKVGTSSVYISESGIKSTNGSSFDFTNSTGNALSPLYSWSYGTTVQYAHGIAQSGFKPPNLSQLMSTYHPGLVLFVITERFLSEKPPKG